VRIKWILYQSNQCNFDIYRESLIRSIIYLLRYFFSLSGWEDIFEKFDYFKFDGDILIISFLFKDIFIKIIKRKNLYFSKIILSYYHHY
jgi:hypothetical protein